MSSDFDTALSYDSRLNDISDKIMYIVEKGAADNTFQQFNSNTESATAVNWTINPPSESTVISREIYIQSQVQFTIRIGSGGVAGNVPVGVSAFQPGLRDGLQAFPLNRIFNTVTISVNNVSTSMNQNLILPGLLRLLDPELLQKYSGGMCPAYLDNYANYPDCPGTNNNPFGDYGSAGYNQNLLPRGVHPLDAVVIRHFPSVGPQDASAISTSLDDYWEIDIDFTSTEPFFISPMLFGDCKFNKSGYLGINNFQVVVSTDATLSRAWNTGLVTGRLNGKPTTPYSMVMRGKGFNSSKLLLNFLTAPISMILPPKVALPYSNYIAYPTTNQPDILPGAKVDMNINSVQLEVVPDKLILFIRRKLSDQDAYESDTFLVINSVQCTFGNKSGLLSNATQNDLFQLSKKNGLHMDYYQFSGSAGRYNAAAPNFGKYATAGSVLVMNPAQDFGLASPYLANGSIGQFNLQIRMSVTNQTARAISPEIVLVAMRSGVIVTSAGQSTLTTNMLNSSIVTKTIEDDKKPQGSDYYQRLVGGAGSSADGPACKYGSGGSKSGGKSAKYSKLASLAM
jgi:hypothetical protein